MQLADRKCADCGPGAVALKGEALNGLLSELPGWKTVNEHHLQRVFAFKDFRTGLAFVNRAGAIAEEQGHHPDLLLGWGKVEVTVFTHSVEGLTENDFILAAKIDRVFDK